MEQLQKPFTMVWWDLDETKDDRILEARISKGIAATEMIYGKTLPSGQRTLQALPEGRNVDMSTGEIIEQPIIDAGYEAGEPEPEEAVKPEETAKPWEKPEEKYYCSNPACKAEIAKTVYDASVAKFGAAACTKCQNAAKKGAAK